jgi:hypothetical protein
MSRFQKILFNALFVLVAPTAAFAQDLCIPPLPSVPSEARAEQLRIDAAERVQREADRRGWEVKMFTVKNAVSNETLRALCIFRVEVVNQPALRLVQVRAPKELMTAVEDAVKRLDVPPSPPPPGPVQRGIELTGYVVFAMEPRDPQLQPIPNELQPVANELKSILPSGTLVLADTFVVRGLERENVSVSGNTYFQANLRISQASAGPVITISNMNMTVRDAGGGNNIGGIQTNVDVPVGTQVVIGKSTPMNKQGAVKAVILVISGKILN